MHHGCRDPAGAIKGARGIQGVNPMFDVGHRSGPLALGGLEGAQEQGPVPGDLLIKASEHEDPGNLKGHEIFRRIFAGAPWPKVLRAEGARGAGLSASRRNPSPRGPSAGDAENRLQIRGTLVGVSHKRDTPRHRLSYCNVGHFLAHMSLLRRRCVTILQVRTSRGLGSGSSGTGPATLFRIPYRKDQYDILSRVPFCSAIHAHRKPCTRGRSNPVGPSWAIPD